MPPAAAPPHVSEDRENTAELEAGKDSDISGRDTQRGAEGPANYTPHVHIQEREVVILHCMEQSVATAIMFQRIDDSTILINFLNCFLAEGDSVSDLESKDFQDSASYLLMDWKEVTGPFLLGDIWINNIEIEVSPALSGVGPFDQIYLDIVDDEQPLSSCGFLPYVWPSLGHIGDAGRMNPVNRETLRE
ncbi:MAG: hypothetical protein ACIAXF_11305 [Phycisphaerales bacterium JB063]